MVGEGTARAERARCRRLEQRRKELVSGIVHYYSSGGGPGQHSRLKESSERTEEKGLAPLRSTRRPTARKLTISNSLGRPLWFIMYKRGGFLAYSPEIMGVSENQNGTDSTQRVCCGSVHSLWGYRGGKEKKRRVWKGCTADYR